MKDEKTSKKIIMAFGVFLSENCPLISKEKNNYHIKDR